MLALDHRDSFKRMFGSDVSSYALVERKREIIAALGVEPSGILVDIEYGLEALRKTGLPLPFLLAMEKSGYEEAGDSRRTQVVHTGRELKEAGAAGAKLLLYMQGDERDAPQAETAKQALADAERAALPFFLEVVVYGGNDVARQTLAALAMLKAHGVRPAVWKLQAPGTPEACRSITEAAEETPWILLSRGTEFERFAFELQECIAAGAKGFLVGRSLWQEALSLAEAERARFLEETMPERFRTLQSIVQEVQ